jgi:hypothetical protein
VTVPVAELDVLVEELLKPRCSTRVGDKMSPAMATEWSSSNATCSRSRL